MPLTTIVWFRQDLRLSDNPALHSAVEKGAILPIFILDEEESGDAALGAASRWWLHHSLKALNESLGGHLHFFQGRAEPILHRLIERTGAKALHWNRCYEPWRIQRDTLIKQRFQQQGIEVASFNGSLLWEPWQVLKSDGTPYKVFTPFFRRGCLGQPAPRHPLPKPRSDSLIFPDIPTESMPLDALDLLPKISWDSTMRKVWSIGETAAHLRLDRFLKEGLPTYKEGRNYPMKASVSRLSAHLHFGEISPNQAWYRSQDAGLMQGCEADLDHFHSELAWREFSYSLLYHFPDLPSRNLQPRFDAFPWRWDETALKLWQQGRTGIPMVDAGMRELWQTGYMHNRVRMIVGSFLVKNLLLHWRLGEQWFRDCLVDADLANNSASWQWIAGCGADAAPYFRIFNPVSQGEKFDPEGEYVRRFIPELSNLPNAFIHKPWEAPAALLAASNIQLGTTYPLPMVDLKTSREQALAAFATLREAAAHFLE